jgi:type IV pilus assembly protein PilY1
MFTTKNSSRLKAAGRMVAATCLVVATMGPGHAAPIDLADQPLFSTTGTPGNLLLALSVEWPTASTPAHLSTTPYAAATTYVGYFDPEKCYRYFDPATPTNPADDYFKPDSMAAANHVCTSTATKALWSGNYLNWASTQTMDAFRWALTGGDRVVDTTTETIIEKTRHSGQGARSSIYPDKLLSTGTSGATPFNFGRVVSRVHGLGTALYFSGGQELSCTFATDNNRRNRFICDASSIGGGSLTLGWTANNTPAAGGSTTLTGALSGSAGTLSCTVTRSAAGVNSGNNYTYTCTTSLSGSTACAAPAVYAGSAAAANCNTAATVTDYTGQSSAAGTASATAFYKVNARVKVCDSSVGLEGNCKQYGSNYKPEGLIQEYAQKLRFSAFGYLNQDGNARDGGVMRARMKYVGPTKPVPGSPNVANTNAEWDATTGIMNQNPDSTDASDTTADSTAAGYTVTITNSGVMNYLNRFGKLVTGNYKSQDPVSEMYYAGQRYFRNLGNVSGYSSLTGAGSTATMSTWLDGFPVVKTWDDPILYSCQKNFILGIGDVNTHRDRNVPGSTITSADELAAPVSDATVNATTANNMIGQLEGTANLPTACGTNMGTCTSGRNNSYYMAGLAYDAHTKDIRSDLTGSQTISTYWLDVMEGQTYQSKNQYWFAAKYGGFTVPDGFSPYAAGNGTGTIPDTAWWTSTEMAGADKRPDNYFLANQADKMVDGLKKAFAKIVSENDAATTTAFSTPTAKVSSTDGASYAASYEPKTWSGIVIGSSLTFAADGTPTATEKWNARTKLEATAPASRKIVTCCTSSGAALPFQATGTGSLSTATLDPRTDYASFANVPGATSQSAANYVAYLRGDRTQELANGGAYRTRPFLLGDVSGSKANPVGPPSAPYFDATNPGYSAYKRNKATRTTVVYVGANDGMMHAFDGTLPGASACATCGSELFAYVPSFTYRGSNNNASTTGLASYGNPSFVHHFFVDATPQSFDLDFKNTSGSTASTPDWRTIVIGGLGKGGKGYYAIDVSDPTSWTNETAVAGKVLWEFTDSRMGYSYGDASVVKTAKYGWVVIFTSGYNNSDGKGYFFIVNPRTGALLEAVATAEGSTTSPLNMAHHTAYVPDYTDFTSDTVYAGDLLGNVWRLDLTGSPTSYPAPTKIATLTDAGGTPQPVTIRPLIEVDPITKKRYVLIGTGRLLADSDQSSTQRQAFYAIVDGAASAGTFYTTTTLPSGASFPITRSILNPNTDLLAGVGVTPTYPMGWYLDLGPTDGTVAERINVSMVSNVGVVGVGVNRPGASACEPGGTSRLLAFSFGTGKSVLVDSTNAFIGQSTLTRGLITDVGIVNASGKIRIVAGDSSGGINSPGTSPPGGAGVKRLNGREVPTVD